MGNLQNSYVKLDKVSKIYKMGEVEIRAVDNISFEISKGEFVVVVGPSGAGKTTVLNILGGMDTATKGNVFVDGSNIAKYNNRQLTAYRRDDIGFVFQFYKTCNGHLRACVQSHIRNSLFDNLHSAHILNNKCVNADFIKLLQIFFKAFHFLFLNKRIYRNVNVNTV